jgi:hypothetical protein
MVILTLNAPGLHRQRHKNIPYQLARTLVKTDNRQQGIIWTLINIQNLFHPPEILGGYRSNAPLFL